MSIPSPRILLLPICMVAAVLFGAIVIAMFAIALMLDWMFNPNPK